MAMCEHAGMSIDVEVTDHRRRKTREIARASPAEERHAVPALQGRARDKRLNHTRLTFIGSWAVYRWDRYVVEAQIDTELSAMVNEMVDHEGAKRGHPW